MKGYLAENVGYLRATSEIEYCTEITNSSINFSSSSILSTLRRSATATKADPVAWLTLNDSNLSLIGFSFCCVVIVINLFISL